MENNIIFSLLWDLNCEITENFWEKKIYKKYNVCIKHTRIKCMFANN